MTSRSRVRSAMRGAAAAMAIGAGAYAAYAAASWWRYGRVADATGTQRDALLDRFMPTYDVVERHHIRVAAPAAMTLAAAREQDLFRLPLVRAIFTAREIVLGAAPDHQPQPA